MEVNSSQSHERSYPFVNITLMSKTEKDKLRVKETDREARMRKTKKNTGRTKRGRQIERDTADAVTWLIDVLIVRK